MLNYIPLTLHNKLYKIKGIVFCECLNLEDDKLCEKEIQ